MYALSLIGRIFENQIFKNILKLPELFVMQHLASEMQVILVNRKTSFSLHKNCIVYILA